MDNMTPAPMPVQQGSKAWPMLIIGILVGAAIGAGGYWWYQQLQPKSATTTTNTTTTTSSVPSATPTVIASPTQTPSSTPTTAAALSYNKFDVTKLKVGDKVGAMTVKSVGKAIPTSSEPLSNNYSVVFTGSATVSGNYLYQEPGLLKATIIMQNIDATSLKQLPIEVNDTRDFWFSFTNQDLAKSLLTNTVGATGPATITIDEFTSASAPAEVGNTAHLAGVVSK